MKNILREDAAAIFRAGVAAVDPRKGVLSHLLLEGDTLVAGESRIDLDPEGRVLVVGSGKAAAPMAAAVEHSHGCCGGAGFR